LSHADDHLSRRTFLAGAGALAATSLAVSATSAWAAPGASTSSLGEWIEDDYGLPAYHYAGPMRFPNSPVRNRAPMIPDDPFFLTGNYHLTLFTHASGLYQILTGERAWGRMNQDDAPWGGANSAIIEVSGQRHDLIGLDAPAAIAATKRFGVGFARYDYSLTPSLSVTRQLSVTPSTKIHEGTSAFLTHVTLHNTGSAPLHIRYSELTRARYQQLFAAWDVPQDGATWPIEPATPPANGLVTASFTAHGKRKLTFPPRGEMSRYEQFPPTLFVKAVSSGLTAISHTDSSGQRNIGVTASLTLKPGESRTLAFITGYTRNKTEIPTLVAALDAPASAKPLGSAFGEAWRRILPNLSGEHDPILHREMLWNAAALESMTTWREYYDETVVPQGTMYDYIWGNMASSRDLAQQALPFCHTNPAIARSTLRFIMKRILPDGTVQLNDEGFGWVPSGAQQTSDQQLYFFLLLAEYLRVTRDASVLTETIGYYPLENSGHDTGLAHVRQAFLFLRDRVGTATHGIIRRWNSDWNDMFGWWPSAIPYNTEFDVGESHMNSSMAIVILGDLASAIDALHLPNTTGSDASELTAAMREYRSELYQSWTRDLDDRAFPRRAWMDARTPLGQDDMWLEPQGYTLLIPEFSTERKRHLFTQLQQRLLKGEALGARQIEKPAPNPVSTPGARENGGFWYALNGPLILGVATFDRAAANDLLRRTTFANYAEHFPHYWTGRWSASDSLDSSLLPTQGLSTAIPWCAHAHAWPLYCYLRLHEETHSA
jgi:Glycosyl hydrolase 36 superfamily, catalytic domain